MTTSPKKISVHGHRGARARRPENTLVAFEYALDEGVDVLELDMAITKDDMVVVSHDLSVSTALGQFRDGRDVPDNMLIREHTLAELREIDFGSKRNPRFMEQVLSPGAKIATLDEVFAMVNARDDDVAKRVEFNIETKIKPAHPSWTPTPIEYVERVLEVLRKHDMVGRAYLQSFDKRTLLAARDLEPSLRRVQLTSDNLIDFVSAAEGVSAFAISPDKDWMSKEDVALLHERGVQVIPWTANRPEDWERLIAMNVDAIISDDPAALIAFLEEKGLR